LGVSYQQQGEFKNSIRQYFQFSGSPSRLIKQNVVCFFCPPPGFWFVFFYCVFKRVVASNKGISKTRLKTIAETFCSRQKKESELANASSQFLRPYCQYRVPPPTTGSSRRLPVFYGTWFARRHLFQIEFLQHLLNCQTFFSKTSNGHLFYFAYIQIKFATSTTIYNYCHNK
jgi:hypothetical protein